MNTEQSPLQVVGMPGFYCTTMLQVSRNIVADFADGTMNITVQGNTVRVTSVELRGPSVIVVPTTIIEQEPANTTLYTALGAGLGAGLILILAVAITLGVVVYVYRR